MGGKCESETRARKLFPEAEAEVEERSKLAVVVVEPTAGDGFGPTGGSKNYFTSRHACL